jgi:hypothetical protein
LKHPYATTVICAADQDLLTILTPVYPDEHTLSLLRNQLRTFAAFADIGSFAAWVMVTPAAKLATLQMFLDFELAALQPELSDKVWLTIDAPMHCSTYTDGPTPSCSIVHYGLALAAGGWRLVATVFAEAWGDGDENRLTAMTLRRRSCW